MKFLLNTRTAWDEPPRARHQLARALSINHEVVFISRNKSGRPSLDISCPETNITVITPSWFIDGRINMRIPVMNELYQRWLFKKLHDRYQTYKIINFDPTATGLFSRFNDVVYFCNDNFLDTKRSKSFLVSLYWTFKQKRVARKAMFCTGVSKYLQNKLLNYNSRSYLLLTGATSINETGNKLIDRNPEEINIVYVGWLVKLNTDWVRALSGNKQYNIYIVGPYDNNQVNEFRGINNILILGEKTGKELSQYLYNADVCIAPYIHDRDTEEIYTMPNKFWLYLSFGKSIVTCRIRNLTNLPDRFVYQSGNVSEFISNIEKAVSEDSPDIFEQRIRFIRQNTWGKRVDELLGLYKKHAVS